MVEKYSMFACAMRFRDLLTVGAISLCGLSPMHAGNGSSKPVMAPEQELVAIQYNIVKGVRQLRTDFTDNRKFVDLLLKAFDEYEKFIMDPGVQDWRPAVKAYHAAFEELKRCLQGEWRRIFGDGPSRFPWNGHSDGATDLWREDDLRRDMPVVLSFWCSWSPFENLMDNYWWGHICRTNVLYNCGPENAPSPGQFYVPNDNKAYVPNDSSAYSHQNLIDKDKEVYKKYVLNFFNESKLRKCREYLGKFFCAPVTELLVRGSVCLQEAGAKDCREDLKLLLNLYADYYSLDSVVVHNRAYGDADSVVLVLPMGAYRDDSVKATNCMVSLMVACYSNYKQWKPEDQKWLCSLLDNLDANYYVKENLHTYCIQSHDLLRGYSHASVKVFFILYGAHAEFEHHTDTTGCKGLMEAFKERGNPLPEVTWQKFVNYAGRRLSLVLETMSWSESHPYLGIGVKPCGQNNANTVWHRSKTFEQIPCAKEVLEEISGQGEAGIKK